MRRNYNLKLLLVSVLARTTTQASIPEHAIVVSPGDAWESTLQTADAGSVVVFSPGVYSSACNIQLRNDVSLVGQSGPEATIIDCSDSARHFHVTAAAYVTIQGLSLVNGQSDDLENGGGCILVEGSHLEVHQSFLSNCSSSGLNGGGAIHASESRLSVTEVNCMYNSALWSGGCIAMLNSTGTISYSQFMHNNAEQHGGGVHVERSTLSVDHTFMQANSAQDRGGGISGHTDSSIEITESAFDSNLAGEFLGIELVDPFQFGAGGGGCPRARYAMPGTDLAYGTPRGPGPREQAGSAQSRFLHSQ
eukprot:1530073-Rhodomonas_salina.1